MAYIKTLVKRTIILISVLSLMKISHANAQTIDKNYSEPQVETTTTVYPIQFTDEEWKEKLTEEQYRILRKKGTEPAFSGKYDHFYEKGIYYSAASLQPVFSSDTKFDSGTGWPSFYAPLKNDAVKLIKDNSQRMERIEVVD